MKLNVYQKTTVTAYEKGYRVLPDGSVSGLRISKLKLRKKYFNSIPYYRFSVYTYDKKRSQVFVHRLAAYQKYKESMFEKGIHVRHIDNNSLNNVPDNIAIGTPLENSADRESKDLLYYSIKAATHKRKFSDNEMLKIRRYHNKVSSYKQTMEKFEITSKGTLYYILNTKYQTKV